MTGRPVAAATFRAVRSQPEVVRSEEHPRVVGVVEADAGVDLPGVLVVAAVDQLDDLPGRLARLDLFVVVAGAQKDGEVRDDGHPVDAVHKRLCILWTAANGDKDVDHRLTTL
jgi:hypothetical protein